MEADPDGQVRGAQAAVAGGVTQVHGVGGRAAQGRGAEVAHDLELPLGVAAGDGHDRAAQALGAEVQAQAAGEEAVAVGVLQQVAGPDAAGGQRTSDEVAPHLDVGARVADGGGIAGGAGRGVHAHDLVARPGEHAEGVVVAQVDLGGEGQADEVGVSGHVAWLDARLIQLLAVEGHVVVGVLQRGPQALQLQVGELRHGQHLGGRLPQQAADLVGGEMLHNTHSDLTS